jgi:hypothetical protein
MMLLPSAKFVSLFYHEDGGMTTSIDKTTGDCYHQLTEDLKQQQ